MRFFGIGLNITFVHRFIFALCLLLGPSTTFSGEAFDIRESVTVYDEAAFNTLFIGVRSLLLNNEPDAAIELLDTHPEFYMAVPNSLSNSHEILILSSTEKPASFLMF